MSGSIRRGCILRRDLLIATGVLVLQPQQEPQDRDTHEKGDIQRVKRIEVVVRVQEGQALELATQTLLRRGLRNENEARYDQVVKDDSWGASGVDYNEDDQAAEGWAGETSPGWGGHNDQDERQDDYRNPWDDPIDFDSYHGQGQRLGTDSPTQTDQDPVVGESTCRQAEVHIDSHALSWEHDSSTPAANARLLEMLRSATHPTTLDTFRPPPALTCHAHGHGNRLVPLPTDQHAVSVPDEVLAAQQLSHHQEDVRPAELYPDEHGLGQRLGDDGLGGSAGSVHGGVVMQGDGQGRDVRVDWGEKLLAERRALGLFRGEFGRGRWLDD